MSKVTNAMRATFLAMRMSTSSPKKSMVMKKTERTFFSAQKFEGKCEDGKLSEEGMIYIEG